jgi:hypothetical protein
MPGHHTGKGKGCALRGQRQGFEATEIPAFMNESGWVLMPSGRWTKTVLKAVGEYLVLSAWIGGEWAITHKGERLAAWHDGEKGADLVGAQALAEEAADKLKA